MPQCAHHVESTTLPNCEDVTQNAPKCNKSCSGDSSIKYSNDKHKGATSYSVSGEQALMTEL